MKTETSTTDRPRLYPVGLVLAGRRCLVVGSGPMAERKAEDLRSCGADVHVAADARQPGDLDGAHLVVVAGASQEVADGVAQSAQARGIPCNVMDVNHLCTFYAPAILRRGSLTVTVATDGKFPLLAVAIRDWIARSLGEAAAPALDRLGQGRDLAAAHFPGDPERRVAALRDLLTQAAFESILAGRLDEFERHWESWRTEIASRS